MQPPPGGNAAPAAGDHPLDGGSWGFDKGWRRSAARGRQPVEKVDSSRRRAALRNGGLVLSATLFAELSVLL